MKKIFFIYLILSFVMYAKAQEVVYKPLNTYYYNHWTADTCQSYESYSQLYSLKIEPVRYAHFKRIIVDKESVTVYGVAFSAIVDTCICHSDHIRTYSSGVNVAYPIADSAYLHVQMRRYDNGAMPLLAEKTVHPLDSIPRYYLRHPHPNSTVNMPIYEAYFPESMTVSEDTIYVGYFIPQPEGPFVFYNGVMNFHTWPISSACLRPSYSIFIGDVDSSSWGDYLFMDTIGGEWKSSDLFGTLGGGYTDLFDMYLFPIIAPYAPPQPQGVEENREEVKVLLSPNPASQVAGVSASSVIERLEVYNTAGEKVYESQPGYVLELLDVSQWPSGVYLLRIHTPQGETTKKLVVR